MVRFGPQASLLNRLQREINNIEKDIKFHQGG